MANHQVVFKIVDIPGVGERPIVCPDMRTGDTVSYVTPDGTLKLTFNRIGPLPLPVPPSDSPFTNGDTTIADANPRALGATGLFHCACEITKPDGTTVMWRPNECGGGGDHDVRPPSSPK